MRLFEEPKVEVVKFAVEDVITASPDTCTENCVEHYPLFDAACF